MPTFYNYQAFMGYGELLLNTRAKVCSMCGVTLNDHTSLGYFYMVNQANYVAGVKVLWMSYWLCPRGKLCVGIASIRRLSKPAHN